MPNHTMGCVMALAPNPHSNRRDHRLSTEANTQAYNGVSTHCVTQNACNHAHAIAVVKGNIATSHTTANELAFQNENGTLTPIVASQE
jgi:hypothetical protein